MKVLLAAILVTGSFSSFAGKASKAQVRFFCQSIDSYMEEMAVDAAIDTKHCLKKAKVSFTPSADTEGLAFFKGKVIFNSPNGKSNKVCRFPVTGELVYKNIVFEAFVCE